jgi:hypothetical protein
MLGATNTLPTAQMLSQKERGASSAKPEKKEDNKAQKSATAKVVGAAAPPTDVEWDVEWDGELAFKTKEAPAPAKKSDAKKLDVEWDGELSFFAKAAAPDEKSEARK